MLLAFSLVSPEEVGAATVALLPIDVGPSALRQHPQSATNLANVIAGDVPQPFSGWMDDAQIRAHRCLMHVALVDLSHGYRKSSKRAFFVMS